MSKFIKVTPKGEKEARIVLATLKPFYLSQGAKVETPTEEEVYQAEPTERPRTATPASANQADTISKLKAEIAEVSKANAELAEHATQDQLTIQQQAAELAELREKLAASETALTETEKALEAARKELNKTKTKAAE